MNNHTLVTIIIPVYNAEKFIDKCLLSALNQTISPKEIICVDDGSVDGSLDILRQYEKTCKDIRVFSQDNNGSGSARNLALGVAKGEYVCFLDADDYYIDPEAIKKMVEACKAHNMKVCGSYRREFSAETGEESDFPMYRDICGDIQEGIKIDFKDIQEEFHYHSYIIRRDVIEDNSIRFPDYRRYQDPPFFLKVLVSVEEYWVIPVEFYCYRKDEVFKKKTKESITDILKGIEDELQIAMKNNLYILIGRLIDRLSGTYFESIITNKEVGYPFLKSYADIIIRYNNKPIYYLLLLWEGEKTKSFSDYLLSRRIDNLILYGAGIMGVLCYYSLQNTRIKINYVIDKEKKRFYDCKVFRQIDHFNSLPIVVTPVGSIGEEIKNQLSEGNDHQNIYIFSKLIIEFWRENES